MNELQEQKRQLLKEQQKKAESSKKKATTKQASPSKLPFVGGFTPKKSTTFNTYSSRHRNNVHSHP